MPLKILAVASEMFPLVKTGGLADAVAALPGALAAHDVAVTTLLPGYPAVLAAASAEGPVATMPDLFGGPARILAGRSGANALLLLDAPHLFDRPGGPYQDPRGAEWADNGARFAALGRAAAHLAQHFDAVHAHDWQAGLAPAYLRYAVPRVPVLATIHNLAFQGKFPAALFPVLGLPLGAFAVDGLEFFGGVGFLKAALWYADAINTVSPTYAAEILTPSFGMGLDGLLRGRGAAVSGILNGIDIAEWDPATDPRLAARFDAGDVAPRAANRAALQDAFGLAPDPAAPLFAFVGRLAWQKGIDLVLDAITAIQALGGQLALLGSGEPALEARCRGAAAANAGRIGTFIGYDEGLARLVYGGADAVLVPSRFEPCGLAQLCALRYGAVPIVTRTGGLSDTVIDANPMALDAGAATGFQTPPDSAPMLAHAIRRAGEVFAHPSQWRRLQANAMACDVSWNRSAGLYAGLLRAVAARA